MSYTFFTRILLNGDCVDKNSKRRYNGYNNAETQGYFGSVIGERDV